MRRSTLGIVALGLLAGCGGASAGMPGATQTKDTEALPEDVDALLARLEASERELQAQLGPEAGTETRSTTIEPGAGAGQAPAEGAPAAEPPADAQRPEPAAEPAPEEPASAPPPPSPCETACRALGSMQRSAERICELTAQADARCTGARKRVSRAEERVARAGCGCD